jgi:hypothetical protein
LCFQVFEGLSGVDVTRFAGPGALDLFDVTFFFGIVASILDVLVVFLQGFLAVLVL